MRTRHARPLTGTQGWVAEQTVAVGPEGPCCCSAPPPSTRQALAHWHARRAAKEMVIYGLKDPYCRFIQPSELASMKKYDITGVGLNLGTAQEYVLKTVGAALVGCVCGRVCGGGAGVGVRPKQAQRRLGPRTRAAATLLH